MHRRKKESELNIINLSTFLCFFLSLLEKISNLAQFPFIAEYIHFVKYEHNVPSRSCSIHIQVVIDKSHNFDV